MRLRTEKGLFRSHDKKSYFSLLFFITETLFPQKSAFLSGFLRHFFQKKEKFQFHLSILTWKKVLFVLRPQRCFFSPFYFVTRLRLVTKKEARKTKKHRLWSQAQKYLSIFFCAHFQFIFLFFSFNSFSQFLIWNLKSLIVQPWMLYFIHSIISALKISIKNKLKTTLVIFNIKNHF